MWHYTLLKTKRSSNGSVYLYPKQMYCYKKVIESIQDLLHKKNFINDCEKWRDRNLPDSTLGDVYEGQVWKDFQTVNGEPFLSAPNNFGLMLNVDWFQPTKHGIHSIGVIYMVVMNLPREQRFKLENVIVVGIIPGPKEPKLHLNTFLQPLIDELVDLWDGVLLDSGNGIYEKYRAALLALSCDIPAIRKCGGFLGHGANRGCNKCYKEFPRKSFGDRPDFSGFNRDDWEKRTHEQCKRHAEHYQQANFCTATKAKACASKTGIRYSVLYKLPYYDAVRFTLIDPTHNLLLGTAKHVLDTWVKEGIISNKDLTRLQARVNKVKAPSNIGRLPSKIANGFAGFTADQWKNWICIYSLFALRGIIPNDHYVMWSDFVHACQTLCSKVLTLHDLSYADEKLNQFCCKFEELLGKDSCTPNMHLHGHLKQCIVDYGPIYSFWCFSFEMYNGILGDYQTNNTNIGLQIMRKFYRDKQVMMSQFPKEMTHVTQIIESATNPKGTLLEMTLPSKQYLEMLSLQMSSPLEVNFAKTPDQVPLLPMKRKALEQGEKRKLEEMYALIYDTSNIKYVSKFCQSFTRLSYTGNLYSSSTTKDDNASIITATWCDEMKRPGILRGFLLHDVILKVENNSQQKVTRFS